MGLYNENEMKRSLSARKSKVAFGVLMAFAAVLFALISLVNHYLFKTYTLDLGLYTHAMYDYTHFRIDDFSMIRQVPKSILSDHFDLYLVILSPLVYVFGTYTLLIVQIVAVLLGGWGIYKLLGLYFEDGWLPVLASAVFFFSFGIIHPLGFEYHSNVLTAMMLPWLLYFFKRKDYKLSALMVVLFVIGKENMSLWLIFIAIGLMWDYRKDRKALWRLGAYTVFAMAYFLIVNMIVMPKLGGSGAGFRRYEYLGDNYIEVAKTLLTHPKLTLKLLFSSVVGLEEFPNAKAEIRYLLSLTIANPKNAGLKEEFYHCALATGLILTLLKPNYLFMLLPLIGQKMFAFESNFWGISFHYSVEFMPVIVISSFLVISKLKWPIWRLVLAVALLLSTILTTFYSLGITKTLVLKDQLCVYQGRHYEQKEFDVDYAYKLIRMIPKDVSVCASRMLTAHLALRPEIYDFQWRGADADATYYLVTKGDLDSKRNGSLFFDRWEEYEVMATDGNLFLLKKRQQ